MRHILFVEDDAKIRELFTRLLTMRGYQVAEARDGEQAVALVSQRRFDVIVMDVKMPKLDGVSAFQKIQAAAPSTKVVLTTGFSMNEELQDVLKQGLVECLRKPFTIDQLVALLDRLVASDPHRSLNTA